MHSKRSLKHGTGDKRARNKRLSVGQRQQSHVPRVRFLEIGGERREIARPKTSGLPTTHAKGKLIEQKANGKKRTLVIRPGKPVRNAILVIKGNNGISQTIHFRKQDMQGPSFKPPEKPPEILNAAEKELLRQIVRSDDKEMNKMKRRCKRISCP